MRCALISLASAALLSACGGGGGGGGVGTASNAVTSGTALGLTGNVSQGFPIYGASVLLTDANGTSLNAGTTDKTGAYSVPDISNLKPPILVSASGVSGGKPLTLYGMLTAKLANSVANVTPLTDAVVTQAAGTSPSLLLSNPSAVGGIDVSKVDAAAAKVTTAVSNVLNQITSGSSANFNPLSTAFNADGVTAADKINDLVKVTSTITPNGVTTDITDKSNSVGTVTISAGSSATALASLPSSITTLNLPKLNEFVAKINTAFSSGETLDSQFPDLIANDALDNGLDKNGQINQFAVQGRSQVIGVKLSNPNIVLCDSATVCLVRMTATFATGAVQNIDVFVKYYPNTANWLIYGNQYKFNAEFGSSLTKNINHTNLSSPVASIESEIQFTINRDNSANWSQYKSARVSLQSGNSAPDLTYNFVLKPNSCSPSTGSYYDGMPLDNPSDANNATNCATWKKFDANTESVLKTINAKIKQGGYIAKFEAWTNSNRSGTPDVALLPIIDPLLTTDSIGSDGYPRVTLVQATSSALPYITVDNADDFTVSGSICITSQMWCDNRNPAPYTTTIMPNGNVKLPKLFNANGWPTGVKAKAYFIHVRDKAGRDLMVSGYNYQ